MRLRTGEKAIDFELPSEDRASVSLSDYHGMWILLYFYPKDDTPGCRREAESLRDAHERLKEKNVTVLGVSTDSPDSHQKFREKYRLPFTLLSDEEGEIAELYGVLDDDERMAKRTSFLIDTSGVLVKIYRDVNPEDHAEEVLHDLEELQNI